MNETMRRVIVDRRMRDRAYRDGNYGRDYARGEFEGEFRGDYESDYARSAGRYGRRRDYAPEEYDMPDGRRGVKGTGPYGIGGRYYYGRRRDRAPYDEDYAGYDYADQDETKLTKREMHEWKQRLENSDGTRGEHFTISQIRQAVQALGLQMRGYDEADLCMTVNMLYSDFCEVFKQFIPKDKEAMVYVKFAKAFLEDPDASVMGSEKLAAYFYAIIDED